jgi:hypothetical protein
MRVANNIYQYANGCYDRKYSSTRREYEDAILLELGETHQFKNVCDVEQDTRMRVLTAKHELEEYFRVAMKSRFATKHSN